MMKKIISVILILCLIFCTFAACGEEEAVSAVYPISADPECVDPQIAENEASRIISENCMEGLVRADKDGKIRPGVAESWEISTDGLTYTFHLRQNAVWQKLRAHAKVLGEDYEDTFNYSVTAHDMVFGIIRALRPETKAKDVSLLYCIKNAKQFFEGKTKEASVGIKATDDYTVVIQLERSNPDFLRILTYPMCMPCNEQFFKATGAKYGLELKYTLCNGPYYVGKWIDDSSLTLYQNEDYKGFAKVQTPAVYLLVNSDREQIISKFGDKSYNTASISKAEYSSVKGNNEITLLQNKNVTTAFIFNCGDKAMSNSYIRKSIICATDFSLFSLDMPDKAVANGIVPLGCMEGEKTYRSSAGKVKIPAYNESKAKSLFAKGLEELDETFVSIRIIADEEYANTLKRVIQKWEKAFSLNAAISVYTPKTEEEKAEIIENGEYQILFDHLYAEDGSAIKFMNRFTSENEENSASFASEKYDKIIETAINKDAGTKICADLLKAEQYLIDNAVVYPVFSDSSYLGYWNSLDGVYASPGLFTVNFCAWSESK